MKKLLARALAGILILSLIQIPVSAEIQDCTQDINVKIIRDTQNTRATIYTGALSEYEDGIFENIDLSDAKFMTIFDWDTDGEVIYIMPVEEDEESVTTPQQLDSVQRQITSRTTNSFKTEVSFWNENEYCEYIRDGMDTIGADIKITNQTSASQAVQPYIAIYKNNKLCEAKALQEQNIASSASVSLSEEFFVDGDSADEYAIKVFDWNQAMTPLSDAVTISGEKEDYYQDAFSNANWVNINKQISGSVSSSDIDFVKFTVPETYPYKLKFLKSG